MSYLKPVTKRLSETTLSVMLALCGLAFVAASPTTALAHQLTKPGGALMPHHHVYRRAGYGNGFQVGHVAPTRHGNDMIIWSPAPSQLSTTPAPRMRIQPPERQRPNQQLRRVPPPDAIRLPNATPDRR